MAARTSLRLAVKALPKVGLDRGDPGPLFATVYEPVLPRLAAVASVSADGLLIELALRDGVATHDGATLSAADFRRSIEVASRGAFATDLRDLAAIEIASPARLRLRLRRPNGYVQRVLAELPVARASSGAGSGPYLLESADETQIVLSRFAGYAGTARGVPKIEIVREPATVTALAKVQVGEIDVAADDRDSGNSLDGATPLRLASARLRYLLFNTRRTLFADGQVRRAAAMVIDRSALARDGHKKRATARLSPMWPRGPIDGAAEAPPKPDQKAASLLLDGAGWTRGSDGTRQRDKEKLLAVAVTGNAKDLGVAIVFDQLRASGFVLDIRELGDQALADALAGGLFDVAVLEWNGFPDWDLSPLVETGGRQNVGGFSSEDVDHELAAMRAAANPSERRKLAPALERALRDATPFVALVEPHTVFVLGEKIQAHGEPAARLDLTNLVLVPESP